MSFLRLRWSLREGRRRWIQIVGVAFTLAIGIGSYAGPASAIDWRLDATTKSLDFTNMYDLRATVSGGGDVPAGTLAQIARDIDGIDEYGERLVVDRQVETMANGEELLAHGRIIGVERISGEGGVNRVEVLRGDGMPEPATGQPRVLIESKFARFHDLPDSGTLTIGGDKSVDFVGHATSPEYFLIVEGDGSLGQSNFVALFAPLATAQDLLGRSGAVNDLVVTLEAGADADAVRQELIDAAASVSGTPLDVITRDETPSYIGLVNAPAADQDFAGAMAFLLFVGAGFAALNFSSRMVEAQRREIGVSMALGEAPTSIAMRPVLIGVQIGILGIILGVALGFLLSSQAVAVAEAAFTYPVFEQPFKLGIYARAAAIGCAVPLLAVLWPVLRAVRVRPVEAIRSGHLASRGGSLGPVISRVPLPGRSVARMPFRNLLRTPRRTFMTLLTFSIGLATLFTIVGFSNSFAATFDRGNQELLGNDPERFMIRFDSLYPVDSPQVQGALTDPAVHLGESALILGASVVADEATTDDGEPARLDLVVRFVDFGSAVWTPTASQGSLSAGAPGIVLADKAAQDLGVEVGDEVMLTHPVLVDGAFSYGTRTLPVTAIHPHPLRLNAYMDLSQASAWGLEGLANIVTGVPADGSSLNEVKRSLFGSGNGVARVQGLDESFQSVEDSLDQVSGFFIVFRAFVVLLLLLIAFNTASINADERARDHATMFAYGVPVRRVIANLSMEGLLLCAAAAVLGVLFGYALLLWMVLYLMPTAIPEIGPLVSVNPVEMALYFAVALIAVALAPVFSARKMNRMSIPSTLRVME